jgi:hypothetical protein
MPHAASLLQALPLPLCVRVVRVGVGVVDGVVVYVCVYLLSVYLLLFAGRWGVRSACVGEVEFEGDTQACVQIN